MVEQIGWMQPEGRTARSVDGHFLVSGGINPLLTAPSKALSDNRLDAAAIGMGTATLARELPNVRMGRRAITKAMLGIGLGAFAGGRVFNPDYAKAVEAVGAPGFGMEGLPGNVEDSRVQKIRTHRGVRVGQSLMANPNGENIEDVEFRPDINIVPGQNEKNFAFRPPNREDVWKGNVLLRLAETSERYPEGEGLEELYSTSEMPPEPNWSDRILQMKDGKKIKYKIRTPSGWKEGVVQEGMIVNYDTADPDMFHLLYTEELDSNGQYTPLDGWSFDVTDKGALVVKVYVNEAPYKNSGYDPQLLYDVDFAAVALRASTSAIMTLGMPSQSMSQFAHNYDKRLQETSFAGLFPDQYMLAFGAPNAAAARAVQFSDRLYGVRFPQQNPLASV